MEIALPSRVETHDLMPLKKDIEGYGVCLREMTLQDLDRVRTWRNDPYIKQFMLTSDTISQAQQLAWFESIDGQINQQHFVIHYKNEPIGAINIKSLDSDALACASRIEPGMYIFDERYRGNFLAFCPALLINDYCFSYLSCKSLLARVLPTNTAAIKFNTALGYTQIMSPSLLEMSLFPEDYALANKKIKRFFR
jgi:RimJ/RimL family protein N-acetyltransferase